MSGHAMSSREGQTVEQQCCSHCNMTYQLFIDNGKPRCPGRPYTNADLWPDIRVKYHPEDIDWMHWAQNIAQEEGIPWRRHPAAQTSFAVRQTILSSLPEYFF